MAEIKQCPYCAEDIKVAAIVCKHCGRELPGFDENAPKPMWELDKEILDQKIALDPLVDKSLQSGDTSPKLRENLHPVTGLLALLLPAWGIVFGLIYLVRARTRDRGIQLIGLSFISTLVAAFLVYGPNDFFLTQSPTQAQSTVDSQSSSQNQQVNSPPLTITLEPIYVRATEGAAANCNPDELIEWSNGVALIVDNANNKAEEIGVFSPETITILELEEYSEYLEIVKDSISDNMGPPCANTASNWLILAYTNLQNGINAIIESNDVLAQEYLEAYDQKLVEFEAMHANLMDTYLIDP